MCYFFSTFAAIVSMSLFYFMSAIIKTSSVYTDFGFVESLCNENNTEHAVPAGLYRDADGGTVSEIFKKGNVSYGCPCSRKACISKCCPFGQEVIRRVCAVVDHVELQDRSFYGLHYYDAYPTVMRPRTNENRQFNIKINFMTYKSLSFTRPDNFRLFRNGTVKVKQQCSTQHDVCFLTPSDYCFDTRGNNHEMALYYSGDTTFKKLLRLLKKMNYVYASIASCSFLILTLLVYAVLPSLQNLGGKCLMCYYLCTSMSFGCSAFQYIIMETNSVKLCTFMGKF